MSKGIFIMEMMMVLCMIILFCLKKKDVQHVFILILQIGYLILAGLYSFTLWTSASVLLVPITAKIIPVFVVYLIKMVFAVISFVMLIMIGNTLKKEINENRVRAVSIKRFLLAASLTVLGQIVAGLAYYPLISFVYDGSIPQSVVHTFNQIVLYSPHESIVSAWMFPLIQLIIAIMFVGKIKRITH